MSQTMNSKINWKMSEKREHVGDSLSLKGEAEKSPTGRPYHDHLLCVRCRACCEVRNKFDSPYPQGVLSLRHRISASRMVLVH